MKITVFGASGAIGNILIQMALEKGHSVNAYVRNTKKVSISSGNLNVFIGELDDKESVQNAIKGADAIISVLGPPLKRNYEGMPILIGHENIIDAMQKEHIKRFITLATPSVKSDKDKKSLITILPGIMGRLFLPKPYKEIVAVGDLVKRSNIDWTIVRIIAPNNKAESGKIKVTEGDTSIGFAISRSDISRFILNEVEAKQYVRSMPIIGS